MILPVRSHLSSALLQPPQFVDIPLEEDDSSDEEYQPDDEDEDETAEEVNAACSIDLFCTELSVCLRQ